MIERQKKIIELKDAYKKLNSLRFIDALSENQSEEIVKMMESIEWQLKSELFKEFLSEQ